MLNLPEKLKILEKEGRKIRVGVVGAGQMGSGLVNLISRMKGMEVVALAEIEVERAISTFEAAGAKRKEILISHDSSQCDEALEDGRKVVTGEARILPHLSFIDVIVEATGVPETGARIAFEAINNKKDVVMMNIEADVTVGPLLAKLARGRGVVYTVGAGDEPSAIKELYDFATSLEFKIVAAGKGKNNPLDREATPQSLQKIASSKGMNPRMLTEFVDGSKTMIEMTALANATGLVPDVRGMHGPECSVESLSSVFTLKEKGGILSQDGVVDYALGDIAPGVFVVVSTDSPQLKKDMNYLKMGSGPNYLLYRPYHLASIEVPLSIARAILYREPTLSAKSSVAAEAITVAKRDLRRGEKLDGIGGYTIYGSIEKRSVAKKENLLPLGLAQGAIMKEDVSKNECITYDDVELDSSSFLLNLRKIQDEIIGGGREYGA